MKIKNEFFTISGNPSFNIDMQATGDEIYRLIEGGNLTKHQIADMLGLATTQAIYNWQNGRNVPDLICLLSLGNMYDICPLEILKLNSGSKLQCVLRSRVNQLEQEIEELKNKEEYFMTRETQRFKYNNLLHKGLYDLMSNMEGQHRDRFVARWRLLQKEPRIIYDLFAKDWCDDEGQMDYRRFKELWDEYDFAGMLERLFGGVYKSDFLLALSSRVKDFCDGTYLREDSMDEDDYSEDGELLVDDADDDNEDWEEELSEDCLDGDPNVWTYI